MSQSWVFFFIGLILLLWVERGLGTRNWIHGLSSLFSKILDHLPFFLSHHPPFPPCFLVAFFLYFFFIYLFLSCASVHVRLTGSVCRWFSFPLSLSFFFVNKCRSSGFFLLVSCVLAGSSLFSLLFLVHLSSCLCVALDNNIHRIRLVVFESRFA